MSEIKRSLTDISNFTLPTGGPYDTFFQSDASLIILEAISVENPGNAKYLRERGLRLVAPLVASHAILGPMQAMANKSSRHIQALDRIQADEADGFLDIGSHEAAKASLMNMCFDESRWAAYLPEES